MRLFTLFISYGNRGHYCGVFPSLECLHGVIHEMAEDERIDKSEIPGLENIRADVTGDNFEDFLCGFKNGTWIHVQETSEQLVTAILDKYWEDFYLDIAKRLDLKVTSLQESKEAEHAKENQKKRI